MKIRTRIFLYVFLSSVLINIGMSFIGDYYLVRSHLKHKIEEAEKVARRVVLESVGLILANELARLQDLLYAVLRENNEVEYLFVEDNQGVLTHTFKEGVPGGLLTLGKFPPQSNLDIIPIENEKGLKFYHIRLKIGKLSSAILHMGLSEQKIKEGVVPFRRAMLIIGCILLLVVPLLFSFILARIISKPIISLRHGSERIGRGELAYRLHIRTGDEIEQLADEFNRMAEKLEVNYATLEQKVAERTENLRMEINERKKALDELKLQEHMLQVSEKKLKEFSRKILSIREEEKKSLASNLHDEVGSMAVALGSCLSIAHEEVKDKNLPGALAEIEHTRKVLQQSVDQLKKLSIDLRPPNLDIIGLPSVLREYFSTIEKQAKIKIHFTVNLDGRKIPDETAIVLYRVSQEAFNNILKHAGATGVEVKLYSLHNDIHLTVSDDGRGFEVEERLTSTNGFGIQGMKERTASLSGTFVITSAAGKGTEIHTTIPITKEHDHEYRGNPGG